MLAQIRYVVMIKSDATVVCDDAQLCTLPRRSMVIVYAHTHLAQTTSGCEAESPLPNVTSGTQVLLLAYFVPRAVSCVLVPAYKLCIHTHTQKHLPPPTVFLLTGDFGIGHKRGHRRGARGTG